MNPEIKKAWIEALRSGKYKQGTGSLMRSNRYCCMGVLIKIANLIGPRDWWQGIDETGFSYSGWETVCDIPVNEGHKLASMNDSGKTFSEIADYIEQNL